jgi:hypothetical protein
MNFESERSVKMDTEKYKVGQIYNILEALEFFYKYEGIEISDKEANGIYEKYLKATLESKPIIWDK